MITVILIFAIIGILDTLYLMSVKWRKAEVKCLFFPNEWCYKVQHSKYSKTLGIPNSYAGFGMYVLILILLYLFVAGSIPLWPLQAIVAFGFLFSLYFLYIQAFVLRAFCTWCVLSFINFAVMAFVLFV